MKITEKEVQSAFAQIEILRGKVESLWFKMDEAEDEGSDPDKLQSYIEAKNAVENASSFLLEAMDNLRV